MIFIILAAMLWGATNPLLKRYTAGFADADRDNNNNNNNSQQSSENNKNKNKGLFSDVMFLLQRPKYLITQAANLSGTVVYFWALRDTDISVASVATNALALAITCVVSALIGDAPLTRKGVFGIVLVMVGLALCTYDSELRKQKSV